MHPYFTLYPLHYITTLNKTVHPYILLPPLQYTAHPYFTVYPLHYITALYKTVHPNILLSPLQYNVHPYFTVYPLHYITALYYTVHPYILLQPLPCTTLSFLYLKFHNTLLRCVWLDELGHGNPKWRNCGDVGKVCYIFFLFFQSRNNERYRMAYRE